jgi:3-methylfumaryl-CoA hydratase
LASAAQLVDPRDGTWEDAQSWVGRELAEYHGADEVTVGDIRRRLEVLAWDCPLHYDEAVARRHGYRTVVAPATMLMTWAMPPYWSPGDPRPQPGDAALLPQYPFTQIPAPGEFIFATSSETEYLEPVYPGDRVSARSVLIDMTRKRLSVGDGAFFLIETTYVKQTGEVVGIERLTVFRYSAAEAEAVAQ